MARSELLYIAIFATIMAISTQQAFALKCWSCNSVTFPFCSEPFDPKNLTSDEKYFQYIDCTGAGCVKAVGNITFTSNEIPSILVSITRTCAPTTEYCKDSGYNFCELCSTDGCNGAAQYGPIALMAAIPVAIARLLLHYIP